MRIIAGRLRGKKLSSPEDKKIRPTLDRVREAIFNMIAFEIPEAKVLDLFGGTGAMSIEAVSRGAAYATVIDNDRASVRLIKKNIEDCSLQNEITLVQGDYIDFLTKNTKKKQKFDIIFVDPPYHGEMVTNILNEIDESSVLEEDGTVVLETDRDYNTVDETHRLIKVKEKLYSKSKVSVYRFKKSQD